MTDFHTDEVPAERGPLLHEHTQRLSYADTDPAGILYYAAWFPRMEALQTEYLFLNGLRQDTLLERFGWWTVSRATHCDYLLPAKLFDEITVELRVGKIGTSSVRFDFEMWRRADNALVATASNWLVSVSPDQRPIRLPAVLRECLVGKDG
ncbi:thioesterase family protein [Arthrobacter sp. ATA002]|uniref:acyl-CoA thioesterase n=1 Tax=Arthrobacter sp. ATA002 TaxID=2991715 RepID=UPI0022A728F2|nr:thioesterase family protein [Arthrobacter sp. ATA002]WAP50498.1 thioesterase family protein [Arthrobacter sp. ATA002]